RGHGDPRSLGFAGPLARTVGTAVGAAGRRLRSGSVAGDRRGPDHPAPVSATGAGGPLGGRRARLRLTSSPSSPAKGVPRTLPETQVLTTRVSMAEATAVPAVSGPVNIYARRQGPGSGSRWEPGTVAPPVMPAHLRAGRVGPRRGPPPTPDVHTPGAHHERDEQSREGHRTLTITLLSTSDTDLLSARASGADFRLGNPRFLDADALRGLVEGSDAVVYRKLGSRHAIADHLDVITASGVPLVVVSGEQAPDADLM